MLAALLLPGTGAEAARGQEGPRPGGGGDREGGPLPDLVHERAWPPWTGSRAVFGIPAERMTYLGSGWRWPRNLDPGAGPTW